MHPIVRSQAQYQFQSTLPRRERRKSSKYGSLAVIDFNPRSREGSDVSTISKRPRKNIFQSTLPRRERHNTMSYRSKDKEFQSTLPRRERRSRMKDSATRHLNFNPRSREGSDSNATDYAGNGRRFQSTLPRRERHET